MAQIALEVLKGERRMTPFAVQSPVSVVKQFMHREFGLSMYSCVAEPECDRTNFVLLTI